MKHETQVELLNTVLAALETGRDAPVISEPVEVPVSRYLDQGVFDREMDTLFRDYPLVAGHASQVREPGSYILSPWDRFPYVVVRDKEGTLRAFLNVCRHRGAPIVSGKEEKLAAFSCPYHGWTYNLDGSLRAMTRPFNFPGMECKDFGLHELPVAEHFGMVWVHPTPGAKMDVPSYLGEEISTDLEHFNIGALARHRKTQVVKDANWKLLFKTYLDRYHVPTMHKNTLLEYYRDAVNAHTLHGPHIRTTAGLVSLPKAREVDPSKWNILNYASMLYTLFPSTLFIVHTNLVSINTFHPIAPDKTIWTHEMLYRPEEFEGEANQEILAKRFANIDWVFGNEDFGIAEKCQRNLAHGGNQTHVLGLEEGLLAVFQQSIDRITGVPAKKVIPLTVAQ